MRAFVVNAIAGAASVALLAGALAQPSRAVAQDVPGYAEPAPSSEETIHGRIASVEGPYAIVVLDDRGFLDNVSLHSGTIINPRGLRLVAGMTVTIVGVNAGSTLSAIEIDAPDGGDEMNAEADYGASTSPDGGAYVYPDYGFGALFGFGIGFFVPPYIVHTGGPAPKPSPRPGRGIEHPSPGRPVRKPLDDQPAQRATGDTSAATAADTSSATTTDTSSAPPVSLPSYSAPLPAYAVPVLPLHGPGAPGAVYRGPVVTQGRAVLPQSRAPSPPGLPAAPRSQAPPRAAPVRSDPAPARAASAPASRH